MLFWSHQCWVDCQFFHLSHCHESRSDHCCGLLLLLVGLLEIGLRFSAFADGGSSLMDLIPGYSVSHPDREPNHLLLHINLISWSWMPSPYCRLVARCSWCSNVSLQNPGWAWTIDRLARRLRLSSCWKRSIFDYHIISLWTRHPALAQQSSPVRQRSSLDQRYHRPCLSPASLRWHDQDRTAFDAQLPRRRCFQRDHYYHHSGRCQSSWWTRTHPPHQHLPRSYGGLLFSCCLTYA